MVVISKGTLKKFFEKCPSATNAIMEWYNKAKGADWADFSELRKTFGSADYADGLYIFNVGGNKYRIIARIIFGARTMYIRFIGTHAEYNKVKLSDL